MHRVCNTNTNLWTQIPLGDYEQHMSHNSVGQSALLNRLTKKYMNALKPESCLFLGIAGGNGLEHINNRITKFVFGVDINQKYLKEVAKRYYGKIPSLKLINIDITRSKKKICQANFIWAALIMEYTGIDNCLRFSLKNLNRGGHLIISIQSTTGKQSVSSTGIESIKKISSIFQTVDTDMLIDKSIRIGFKLINQEENFLPDGKSLRTFHFAG